MFKFIQTYIDKKVESIINKRLSVIAERLITRQLDEEYSISDAIDEVVVDQVESELNDYMNRHLEEVVDNMCEEHVKYELDSIDLEERVNDVIENYVVEDLGYQGKLLDLFKEVVTKLESKEEKKKRRKDK